MVNGNYVLYGDRPSSDSEIVDDHVQTRTAERKPKKKARTTNEHQHSRNRTELDNETDAVKFEKKIKEPRLLRYVPTSEVEEHFVTQKFETYDLRPPDEPVKRHAFTKKPKNPADGSINYAYSRSSSSCSSPNLPTISEHVEQYGTYRVRSTNSSPTDNIINGYDTKLDKYFSKPRETKAFAVKGSHPDSLYRVSGSSGGGADKAVRALRLLRWPLALFTVCAALAAFVYFLMPVHLDTEVETVNATNWEDSISEAQSNLNKLQVNPTKSPATEKSHSRGTKTSEIDFYDSDSKNYDLTSIVDIVTEKSEKRKLPIPPIFPTHISPEVQYGNEKADSEKSRSPKLLKVTTTIPSDSTLKPHITQKPEKPLAVYFKEGNALTTTTESPITESITHAETSNDIIHFIKQQANENILQHSKSDSKPDLQNNREISSLPRDEQPKTSTSQNYETKINIPQEVPEYHGRPIANGNIKFTSGHSMLFGISIEDAANMKSTTQNALYNTRVSPTLPSWRDRDEATTKKYPVNSNFDVSQCRSTRLALCRGVLPYDLAGSPATVRGVDVTTLLPQIEYLVSTNCSQRVRHFACALLEPECSPPPYPTKMPCYNFCKAIVDSCEGMIPAELQAMFKCNQYSSNSCTNAHVPCYSRELACGDGSCVPRDWVCDGTRDCPGGEDEEPCASCEDNEYRCNSGLCITKRWLCDGYSDCPTGEDEHEDICHQESSFKAFGDEVEVEEPGEELAGSAPAPSIRKPNRLPIHERIQSIRNGENDSSKELLMTSDSSNAFRRNYTRRPSLSRLTPYKRPKPLNIKPQTESNEETMTNKPMNSRTTPRIEQTSRKEETKEDTAEDIDTDDLGLFGDIKKKNINDTERITKPKQQRSMHRTATEVIRSTDATRLDKSENQFEKVIDGSAMLRKAAKEQQVESQNTKDSEETGAAMQSSAHASPCPAHELRCVDGRCIALAQLCDGTVDCSDHADEDNCFT